jgi:hypothetical protein
LTIRTNKPFDYVTDCISQALLWIYIREGLLKLQGLSLRGAQEANSLLANLEAEDPLEKSTVEKTLAAAAAKLGIGADELRNSLVEVTYDPYTEFLVKIWN